MIEAIQFSGAMEGRNIYGRPFASLDLRKQLSVLLKIFGGEHIERDKKVSLATKKARAIMVYSMFDDLRQIGYPIKNILNFSQKHVQAAVSLWLKDERAASTIQFRFSVMRWLTRSIGKPDMIKGYAYYGNRIYYVCRIFGITKDQLNITPHGLRHGYANDK